MGERKVLNKFYPADFDPAKIPRRAKPTNNQIKVRMMLPMSIRCNFCNNFIYKGTKFNSRKETVLGEKYLEIRLFRFYFNCSNCSSEITMRTDPQNSDYVVESGASRNFEAWRGEDDDAGAGTEKRDAIECLENRMSDSKREMDIVYALDEMISMKTRRKKVGLDSMLQALEKKRSTNWKIVEDESVVKSIVFKGSRDYVHRISDDEDGVGKFSAKRRKGSQESQPFIFKAKKRSSRIGGDVVVGCSGLQLLCQN